MNRLFFLLTGLSALILSSCAGLRSGRNDPGIGFDRSDLLGVWEAVGYEEFTAGSARPGERRLNDKYCFGNQNGYLALAPDAVNDSADGLVPWHLAGDVVVFDQPSAPAALRVGSVDQGRMELYDGGIRIILRRVSPFFDEDRFVTPVLTPRSIPVLRQGQMQQW